MVRPAIVSISTKRVLSPSDECSVPPDLRSLAQATLTEQWTRRLPLLQVVPPAAHATTLLTQVLANISDSNTCAYTVVDFCSGTGGPVPTIERTLNASRTAEGLPPIPFRLSDIHPPIDAYIALAAHSPHLSFFPQPVDARLMPAGATSVARRPEAVQERIDEQGPFADDEVTLTGKVRRRKERGEERRRDAKRRFAGVTAETKVLHLFCLAFHHFSEAGAREVLRQTLGRADAFVVLELQDRSPGCLAMMFLEGLVVTAVTCVWFWGQWSRWLLTYLLPILPILHTWDGLVSCLRTRTFEEMRTLIDSVLAEDRKELEKDSLLNQVGLNGHVRAEDELTHDLGDWPLSRVRVRHTWPCGYLLATIGIRKEIRRWIE